MIIEKRNTYIELLLIIPRWSTVHSVSDLATTKSKEIIRIFTPRPDNESSNFATYARIRPTLAL